MLGEARAGVDGNPCAAAPTPTTPTTPGTPAAPGGPARLDAVVSSGRPGDEVAITGSGFGASQGPDSGVSFRGEPATAVSWSDGHIVVLVPNLTPGPGDLRLRVSGVTLPAPAFELLPDPPQPPVVNLLVVPVAGGRLLVDTSLTVDPDGSLPGQPAEQGDNATLDLNDGRRATVDRQVTVRAPSRVRRVAGKARVTIPPTRVPPARISIPSQLVFDVGSAELRSESGRFLRQVARVVRLAKAPARVVGYTDTTGPPRWPAAS